MATTLRRLLLWPLAAAGLWTPIFPTALAADCSIPAESFLFEPMLPRTVAALSAGEAIKVVAIGSASTEGRAAGGPEHAWPQQLGTALSKRYPAAEISVVNLGKARQSAADMAARFEKEVIPLAPLLVVWQTGTVDAVQSVDPAEFRATLQSGFARLKAVSEVVVMDPQFSRRANTMIDFAPYESVIREVADANDVPLFPRRELMRHWLESGEIVYSAKTKEERRAIARRVYGCVGHALAAFIARPMDGEEMER